MQLSIILDILGFNTVIFLFIMVIVIGSLVALYYFLFRWIFEIEKQLKNQRSIIILLLKMCEKEGVIEDDLIKEVKRNL